MVILFIGLASAYTDGMTYQDQMLVTECIKSGHEVYYISDAHEFANGKLQTVEAQERVLSNGLHLIQVKYSPFVCKLLTDKLRIVKGIRQKVEKIEPQVIYIHGPSSIALYEVVKYVQSHPSVKLMVDSHTDFYTSGTNWLSRKILHGLLYKRVCKKCLQYADTLLCVSVNCMKFAEEIYKVPKEKLELFFLGGNCMSEEVHEQMRSKVRKENQWGAAQTVFVQAGKIDEKKCLLEALEVFTKFKNPNWLYVVIGYIEENIKSRLDELCLKDDRIKYLGWKSGEEVAEYLAACDLYIQPGKVSALAQNAMCAGTAVCLRDFEDYRVLVKGNGWLVSKVEELERVFAEIEKDESILKVYGDCSKKLGAEYLDYKLLASKIYV